VSDVHELLTDLQNLKRKVRDIEADIHNRVRAVERRLVNLEKHHDELTDRIEHTELELRTLRDRETS
jgi:chromosome segregation ATPase